MFSQPFVPPQHRTIVSIVLPQKIPLKLENPARITRTPRENYLQIRKNPLFYHHILQKGPPQFFSTKTPRKINCITKIFWGGPNKKDKLGSHTPP